MDTYIQVGTNPRVGLEEYFKLWVKSLDIPTYPKLKDLQLTSNPNEDGDNEFIPAMPYFDSYEFTAKLAYIGLKGSLYSALSDFISYIGSGEFSLFSPYENKGVRCRYAGYEIDEGYKARHGIEKSEFSLKFKVNNPVIYGINMPDGLFSKTTVSSTKIYWSNGTVESFNSGVVVSKNLGTSNQFAIIEPINSHLRIVS